MGIGQTVYTANRHFSTVGTDLDEFLGLGGPSMTSSPAQGISTKGASEVTFAFMKFSDTGTATLTAYFQWLFQPTGLWVDLEDYGGTPYSSVVAADAAVDTLPRLLMLTNYVVPGTPTAGVVTFNTTDKAAQLWIPEIIRVRLRHGGTTVSNEWAGQLTVRGQR